MDKVKIHNYKVLLAESVGSPKSSRFAFVIASSKTPQVALFPSSLDHLFKTISNRFLCPETSSFILSSELLLTFNLTPICLQRVAYLVRISLKPLGSAISSAKNNN